MPQHRSGDSPGGARRGNPYRDATDLEPGPLNLAGDLFLIMLNGATGRLRVRRKLAGYALAGALLMELRQSERVSFDAERIEVRGGGAPTELVLSRLWRLLVADSSDRLIVPWLQYLATTAVDEVADRLVADGWIRRRIGLGLSGRREVFVPQSRNAVFWRAGRLLSDLNRYSDRDDLALTGLLDAVGAVDQTLTDARGPVAQKLISRIGEHLASDAPQASIVCGHVQALAARAAISLR